MAQSTPQPIPVRSSHPSHANHRRAGRTGSPSYTLTPNTDEELGMGSSTSDHDNEDCLENKLARNLRMDTDDRVNSGAGDKVPSNNLDQARWDCFQYPSDHGPLGSLQSSSQIECGRDSGTTDGTVAESGKDEPELPDVESLSQSSFGNLDVPQRESGRSDMDGPCNQGVRRDAFTLGRGHRRPNVSIDTSPASLQRRFSPVPPIRDRAAPLTAQARQPESHMEQTDKSFRPAFASFQPNIESQLSLELSRDKREQSWNEKSRPTDSAKTKASTALSPILSPPLSQSSFTDDYTDQTPPSSASIGGRSSLTWALPPLPEARASGSQYGLSKVPPKSQSFIPTRASLSDTIPLASSTDDPNSSTPKSRVYRSKSVSWLPSGTNRSSSSSYSSNQSPSSAMITSSSYSSLPYSPAVAFLSNFVDSTLPVMPLDEEGSIVGNYIMGKVIGHGGFSIVREAFSVDIDNEGKERERVAVKIVKTQTGATDNDRVQKMLNKEITIWSQISHPNILPFIAVEKLSVDTFIFCEICTGGHLLHYLTRREATASSPTTPNSSRPGRPLDEEQARIIFNQVAEAVRYLHEEKHVMHRDIKLENILHHESGVWKLCDFGLAEYQDEEAAGCFGDTLVPSTSSPGGSGSNAHKPDSREIGGNAATSLSSTVDEEEEEEEDGIVGGSLAYCSPEQLRSNKPLRCPLSDIWSLGVVLYALLTGRLPFQDEYEPRLQLQILNGRYEEPTDCSAEARDLLKNMFRSKLADRWNIGQVKDSPWCMGTTGINLDNSSDRSDINSNIFASFKSTL